VLATVFWDKDGICLETTWKRVQPSWQSSMLQFSTTEAATGLQISRQVFKRNSVSSRQCCSSLAGHYVPKIGKSSEVPSHLIWYLWITASFLTLWNTSSKESFQTSKGPHKLWTSGLKHNRKNFLWVG
jgi:hypothetical protein